MSDLTAKAAYLKGLADGMKLDTTSDVNKLISSMLDLFSDMANEIDAIDNEVGFLADSVEVMDGELDTIAEMFAALDCEGDCGCGDDGDDDFEIVCPTCNRNIPLDMNEFNDETDCPFCGEMIEFDFDFGDEAEG